MIIYKTTNLQNNKIYIGKSIHNKSKYLGSGKLLIHAIKKYGRENFKKEIIDTALSIEDLNEKEKYWIKKLNSQNQKIGYNLTNGGDGGDQISNHPLKDEIRKKQSISHKKIKMSKQCILAATKKRKLVHPAYGSEISEDEKMKYRKQHSEKMKLHFKTNKQWNFGKSPSDETKKKISIAKSGKNHHMYGKHLSNDLKDKIGLAVKKAKNPWSIEITDINGKIMIVDYLSDAAKVVNGSPQYIKWCLTGKKESYKSFKFKYIK